MTSPILQFGRLVNVLDTHFSLNLALHDEVPIVEVETLVRAVVIDRCEPKCLPRPETEKLLTCFSQGLT